MSTFSAREGGASLEITLPEGAAAAMREISEELTRVGLGEEWQHLFGTMLGQAARRLTFERADGLIGRYLAALAAALR
jgi:hypothetical protein